MRFSDLSSFDKEQISTHIFFITTERTGMFLNSSLTFLGIIEWFWLDAICNIINDIVPV